MSEKTALSFLQLFAALTIVIGMSVAVSAQTRSLPTNPGPTPPINSGPNTRSVPELNPATGATALALLTGGILVLRGRKR